MKRWWKPVVAAVVAVVTMAAGSAALGGVASAAGEGTGLWLQPSQPYVGNRAAADWEGTYVLSDGSKAWCVQFALNNPSTATGWLPDPVVLTDKWGGPLSPEDRARAAVWLEAGRAHAESPEWSAAVAILLHQLTGSQRPPDAGAGFREVGYDYGLHYRAAPGPVRKIVDDLRAAGDRLRGPWTVAVAPPSGELRGGQSAPWTLRVASATGDPVPGQALTVAVSGGTGPAQASTGPDGAVTVPVTPGTAGSTVEVSASTTAPATDVRMRVPAQDTVQRAVVVPQPTRVRGGNTREVTQKAALSLVKVVEGDKDLRPVPGAVLKVTGQDGTVIADKVTTADKPVLVDAWPGTVLVSEVSAPGGLERSGEVRKVELKSGQTAAVAFADTVRTVVRKLDADTRQPLAGAQVQLYADKDGARTLGEVLTTGPDGTVAVPGGLAAGRYWIRELVAPQGYQVDTALKPVTVAPKAEAVAVDLVNARIVVRTQDRVREHVVVRQVTAGPVSAAAAAAAE